MDHLKAFEVIFSRGSSLGNESGKLKSGIYAPGKETIQFINSEARVLVVGAGGLGCEILKGLALSGIYNLHVLDMDSIDVTNLNRQFLFRQSDIGKMKAERAAVFINNRIPEANVNYSVCPIQEKNEEFFRQFHLVIAGLDNIEARRWINSVLVGMVTTDEDGNVFPESIIPLIDGGSEAFKGQARVIIPSISSCFECSMDSFTPQKTFPLCTVAETPRRPEHCIAYVLFAIRRNLANQESDTIYREFLNKFGTDKVDCDNPDHIRFMFLRAKERADAYSIEGVNYSLTLGVVKNIIPAVASTNAIIAAVCSNEALKLLSWGSQSLNTYWMYNGTAGVYSYTFKYEKKPGCLVCDVNQIQRMVSPTQTLAEFIDELGSDAFLKLEKPSIVKPGMPLFLQAPKSLKNQLAPNLKRKLDELLNDGDLVSITDPALGSERNLEMVLKFT